MGAYIHFQTHICTILLPFASLQQTGIFSYIQLLHSEWGLTHLQDPSPLSSQQSPSTSSPASWNQAIDPRLFSNGIATAPYPALTTSTTSELANALTLPTPRPKALPDTPQQPADQPANGLGESSKPNDKPLEPPKYQDGGESSSVGFVPSKAARLSFIVNFLFSSRRYIPDLCQ